MIPPIEVDIRLLGHNPPSNRILLCDTPSFTSPLIFSGIVCSLFLL